MNTSNHQTEAAFIQQARVAHSMLSADERAAFLAQIKGGVAA